MGAGKPDYQRLHDIGKLPQEARKYVPGLAQLDEANEKIQELEKELAKFKGVKVEKVEEKVEVPTEQVSRGQEISCSFEGCEYIAKAETMPQANRNLLLHSKKHAVKE